MDRINRLILTDSVKGLIYDEWLKDFLDSEPFKTEKDAIIYLKKTLKSDYFLMLDELGIVLKVK
jgi:hypothetical protein